MGLIPVVGKGAKNFHSSELHKRWGESIFAGTRYAGAICKRIKELHEKKLSQELGTFEVGEKVLFKHQPDTISGTVLRINKKS